MSEPLSEGRLREIRERAVVATRGPWYLRGEDGDSWQDIVAYDPQAPAEPWEICSAVGSVGSSPTLTAVQESHANARFIAASREDVPALLAERDRLAALLAEVEALLRDAAAHGELEQYRRGWEAAIAAASVLTKAAVDYEEDLRGGGTVLDELTRLHESVAALGISRW